MTTMLEIPNLWLNRKEWEKARWLECIILSLCEPRPTQPYPAKNNKTDTIAFKNMMEPAMSSSLFSKCMPAIWNFYFEIAGLHLINIY